MQDGRYSRHPKILSPPQQVLNSAGILCWKDSSSPSPISPAPALTFLFLSPTAHTLSLTNQFERSSAVIFSFSPSAPSAPFALSSYRRSSPRTFSKSSEKLSYLLFKLYILSLKIINALIHLVNVVSPNCLFHCTVSLSGIFPNIFMKIKNGCKYTLPSDSVFCSRSIMRTQSFRHRGFASQPFSCFAKYKRCINI